ncbi:YifB family Mg chelatase-like AAA ATPase [Haloechinothrix sp. YIM 98757]|uniref:YifB family Mg chelatase-like AAA ATPase n=1 Tax=Haloechinothrix aidingensis TaxID=2752311 RepID=A0A838AGL9_9PSEU|nr:YifB family Mg chelatase-like AAA ATPase [Haloechinothrix aidingensis]MBA0128237.1 YifB family Mg chelatase-like AAA ATPase [Haloechinothrix aidingensis]
MALGRAWSIALLGLRGTVVEIEADIGAGLPGTKLLGLPDPGLREAKDRVRAAVRNSGNSWPDKQVILGLSPANLPKVGSAYDLAIAIATLVAAGVAPDSGLSGTTLLGELALDGRIRHVRGVLPSLLAAREAGMTRAVVPAESLAEGGLVPGMEVYGAAELSEVLDWLRADRELHTAPEAAAQVPDAAGDLADVVGQPEARHALEVAAAGGHHLLLIGPPGVGKSMLAHRLPGLLPLLDDDEALEATAVRSVDGSLPPGAPLIRVPPLVAPHHSTSVAALIGGGSGIAAPGAISRAHRGVLLLDEACEYGAERLESLRTALEEGEVRLARSRGAVTYPARFQLVLATNPCPCAPARESECSCSPAVRRSYLGKLSGPLLDRVDIQVRMRPVTAMDAHSGPTVDSTDVVRGRVLRARDRALRRWSEHGWRTNAEVPGPALRQEFALPATVTAVLDRALERSAVTARGADRCLRLAWTLADLAARDRPEPEDVAAALEFRDRRAV